MTESNPTKPIGRGPLFYAGLMFAAYGVIAALGSTDTVGAPLILILMILPLGFVIPMTRAANRKVEAGGAVCLGKGQAQSRYIKRVALFSALYLLTFALMTFTIAGGEPTPAVRAFLAFLPGLAVIGIFWAIARLIVEEQDEFMRMLIIRQSLVGTGLTLCSATIWGFLESADVVPHLDAYWWAIVWFFGLGIGAIANRVQYGTWGAV